MLVPFDGNIIEAVEPAVIERALSLALTYATLAIVIHQRNMTGTISNNVIEKARIFARKPYDKFGAAGASMSNTRGVFISTALTVLLPIASADKHLSVAKNASAAHRDDGFFCSELVAWAF